MIHAAISGTVEENFELRTTSFGDVLSFRLKCDDSYTTRTGEVVLKNVWVPCVAWKQKAHEIMAMGIAPGDYLEIEGKLTSMKADAEKGTQKYTTQVSIRDIKIITPQPEATPF
jgi:single-strand DNA-binding protein